MAGGPDTFVVCNNCQSEVSPYITECPYCGHRVRQRAPKLNRDGRVSEPLPPPAPPEPDNPPPRRLKAVRPEPPQRSPRIRPQRTPRSHSGRLPWATLALVLTSIAFTLLLPTRLIRFEDMVIFDGGIGREWWRLLTTSFVYFDPGYRVVALAAIAIFGILIERRHGAWATLSIYLVASLLGFGLVAATGGATSAAAFVGGGNAPALALMVAWALPTVMALRRGEDPDIDMLGLAVGFALLLALPLASAYADVLAGFGGILTGLVLGFPLARMAR